MKSEQPVNLQWPTTDTEIRALKAGDEVFLSGTIYSARDQAHKRMTELLQSGKPLPFRIENSCIYYMGPTPTPPGEVIGSCGPTTASRMDRFTPELLDAGLAGIIGKGNRNKAVVEAIRRNGAVYFYAYGGCGALYADRIVSAKTVAFPDLGPEAVRELQVKDFPVIVAIDSRGTSIFE